MLTALPIGFGVSLRAAAPKMTAAIAPVFSKMAIGLFLAVIAGAIASNWRVVKGNFAPLGLGLFALAAALSVLGFAVSRLLGLSDSEPKTISIETSVQNGALALAVAGLLVANGPTFNAFAIPAAIYSVVWLASALPAFLFIALKLK